MKMRVEKIFLKIMRGLERRALGWQSESLHLMSRSENLRFVSVDEAVQEIHPEELEYLRCEDQTHSAMEAENRMP